MGQKSIYDYANGSGDPEAGSALESQIMSLAKQLGYRVEKSSVRKTHINNRGLYRLVDNRNTVVAGATYDATIDELIGFLIQKLDEIVSVA
jgi:hypothetical protein